MPDVPTSSKFFAAMAKMRPMPEAAPINRGAIRRDARLAIDKATALLGYRTYLDDARRWKARAAAVPPGFEREVQAQAAGAMVDTHALASAALRMTSQFKASGRLDRMFAGAVATLGEAGTIPATDLVAGLGQDASIRQILRDEGVSDEMWDTLVANVANIDAHVSAANGSIVADVKAAGQDQRRTLVFAPPPAGMPQTVVDLLRRGSFERLASQFIAGGGTNLHLLPGPTRDLELPDVILGASIFSLQAVASHKRGLQDAGLAKYAGNAPVVIWAVAALACLVVGYLLAEKYCKHDGSSESAACIAATILFILGCLGTGLLLMGLVGLIVGPSSSSGGCTGAGDVYYYSPIDGSSGCGPKSIAPGDSTYP